MKMTQEEKEELQMMFMHSGWPIFERMLEEIQRKVEYAVLTYNLKDGPEELVHAKARAEGSAQTMRAIRQNKTKFVKEIE